MTEPKGLLLVNEQRRRSNRRWKALALAACAAMVLAIGVAIVATTQWMRLEDERWQAESPYWRGANATWVPRTPDGKGLSP
jgi:hypothetical protein